MSLKIEMFVKIDHFLQLLHNSGSDGTNTINYINKFSVYPLVQKVKLLVSIVHDFENQNLYSNNPGVQTQSEPFMIFFLKNFPPMKHCRL